MIVEFFCDGTDHRAAEGHFDGGVGVYLHGKAEDEAGFDIPSSNINLRNLDNGVYEALLNGRGVYTLFMWRASNTGMLRGLVVDNTEKQAVAYARELYNRQPIFI